MKNSNELANFRSLPDLLAYVRETEAVTAIFDKIDRAYHSFSLNTPEIRSHREFTDAIAGLIRHIYQFGLAVPKIVGYNAALSDGLDLINSHYENQGVMGFEAALLDATDRDGPGPEYALRRLTEIIRDLEVQRYLNAKFISAIDPTDRDAHRRIVEHIFEMYSFLLPEAICDSQPDRFAKFYRELLELITSSDSILRP